MRKKYLSALLFGALLFASAGTFTSCKDYDDDIENLQGQISANKEAIAKLQSLVDAGDYVTGVSKDASGNLVFAFSKSGSKTIELDKPEKAQKLEIKGGELYIDDAPTGIKVAEPAKPVEDTHKDQIIIENGVWSVLQEDGTYKSTGIPVSGVTAVKNDKQQWVLTITDANGATAKVIVPSAASVMSDLELVGWFNTASGAYNAANNTLDLGNVEGQDLTVTSEDITVNYCYITAIIKDYDGKETTWSAQKDVVKKQVLTTLAPEGTKLVARVAPADLDLSSLNFSLQDSKGNKLPISLTSSNFTGKLTRAAANSSIHFLSLDITDATYDAATNYTNLFGGNDDLYSLVEESGARSTYGKFGIKAQAYDPTAYTPLVNAINPNGTLSNTASQGNGLASATPFIVDLNTPTKLVFSKPEDVYDYYVEPVDQAAADEFGFSTDKKKGTITLTKSIDLVTRAALELNVYALRVDGKIFKSQVWVKPSSILSAAVTLNAGEKVIAPIFNGAGVVTTADKTQFTVSLADMFASMSATDKSRWMSAVTGANGRIEVAEFKNADGAYSGSGVTVDFLKADGTVGDNTNAASLLVTVPYKSGTTIWLTPYKEYTMKLNFLHRETGAPSSVMNTVKVTVTPTLPTLSSYMTKRSALWDGNKLMAYFDDPASPTVPLASKYKMNNGFTKLGWKDNASTPNTLLDITFAMDADQKLEASNGNKYAANDAKVTAVTGNVIEIKKDYNDKVRTNMPLAYGKDLNVKVNAEYMGVYDYSDYATTKAQLADAAFQIKVQSALEAGTIAPANGSSISLTPSGASRLMQITAKDIKATAYNQDAPYNVFKEVLDATTSPLTIGWRYSYIRDVKFESADNLLYTVENSGAAVDPTYDTTANKEVESYVSLKAGNTTSATQTTIKVTVTDWYGYTKVVNLPITINKANTGNN